MTRRYLLLVIAIYAIAFLVPAWPWLSGAVTVPYDAKSTFFPPIEFMARAFHSGESPFWTTNVFAGWPNIADPQSMLLSPLHVLLALSSAAPGMWANDAMTFAYLFMGGVGIILFFPDPRWAAAGGLGCVPPVPVRGGAGGGRAAPPQGVSPAGGAGAPFFVLSA